MRLNGYEGLATAIVLQAAKDYVWHQGWLNLHGKPINADARILDLRKRKWIALEGGFIKEARAMQREINDLLEQAQHEVEVKNCVAFFRSKYMSTISTIDGLEFMDMLDEKMADNPKFKINLGDDF